MKDIGHSSWFPDRSRIHGASIHNEGNTLESSNLSAKYCFVLLKNVICMFFFLWPNSPIQALIASMKLSVSLQLLELGQWVGLLGRVISSSQGLYLYTNTEKRTHNTNTKHPCSEWNSNPRSLCSRERRQFMHLHMYS
jgi:hypothetical protein